jgi:subfamily B ATP-binding cassette protein MsbA
MFELIIHYWQRSPLRFSLLIIAITASNVLEGIGLGMLLPVIEQIQGKVVPESKFARLAADLYGLVGLPWVLEAVLGGMCAVFLIKGVVSLRIRSVIANEAAGLQHDLRTALLRHLLSAKLDFVQGKRIGDHLNSLTTESMRAATALFLSAQWLSALLSMLAYLGVALAISASLAISAALLAVAVFQPLSLVARRAVRFGQRIAEVNENMHHHLVEALQAIKLIKSAGLHEQFLLRLNHLSAEQRDWYARSVMNSNSIQIYGQTLGAIFLAVLLVVASRQGISLAEQGVFLFAFLRLLPAIQQLHGFRNDINANVPAYKKVSTATTNAGEAGERTTGHPIERFNSTIKFQQVCVTYGEHDVLNNVTLTMRKGETVALIGPSGAGKTTLADTLLGLVKPRSGTVTIDGIDLERISLPSWRGRVAYVPQEVFLFNDTIRNNITWGDPRVSQDRLEVLTRLAQAHDFIISREHGYDALVGDRGVRLSGGQRQRIAIARALLHEPDILILDEATSALDHENEQAIARMIESLKLELSMTIVVIAHRPSTVRSADRIYVLRDGRIVDHGTWKDIDSGALEYLAAMSKPSNEPRPNE